MEADPTIRVEVQDAIIASWRVVDQQQGRGQELLYAADAEYTTAGRTFTGRDEIAAGLAERVAAGTRTSRHVLTNFTFAPLESERIRANYLVTLYARPGEPPRPMADQPLAVGDIEDIFVRSEGAWLIERRVFTAAFVAESAASPFLNGEQGDAESEAA